MIEKVKDSVLVLDKEYKPLDRIISNYYGSVEDLFYYRRKHQWKRMLFGIAALLGLVFLVFNILPIFPLFNTEGGYMLPVYAWIKKETKLLQGQEYNFWIQWALGVLVSAITFVILFLPALYWKRKKRKFLDSYLLSFCYSYLLEKEIRSYLINENEVHLDHVVDYFKRIVNNFLTIYFDNESGGTTSVKLETLSEALIIQNEIFELSGKSKRYVEALHSIDQKVISRLKKKIEINRILPIVEYLTYYHFSKIKPQEKLNDGNELKGLRSTFLENFIKELESLEPLQPPTDENRRTSVIESFVKRISSFFTHSNIFVLFSSWFLLFLIIFFPLALSMIKVLTLNIDSTFLIGILTTPFLGAVTMVGIITNQKKNS